MTPTAHDLPPAAGAHGPAGEPPSPPAGTPLLVPILLALIVFLVALIGVVLVGRELAQRRATGQGRPLEEWIGQLEEGASAGARREAAEVITRRGPEAVIAALEAITELPGEGEAGAASTPALSALAAVGPDLVQSLVPAMANRAVNVRLGALGVLRAMGGSAPTAVEAVAAALADPNRWVRWSAAETLGQWGPEAAPATEALATAGRHEDYRTRLRAVRALGQIGPAARAAVPTLIRARDGDPQATVRRAAAAALDQVDPRGAAGPRDEAVRRLMAQLGGTDPLQQVLAAERLGEIGPAAAAALPALRRTAAPQSEPDPEVRAAAGEAISRIEAPAPRP